MKFLSWRTRLHICPSFFPLKATANFTHPYLAPFSGKVPVSSWVEGNGPFAMLGNREREIGEWDHSAPWGFSLRGGSGASPSVSMAAAGFIKILLQMRHDIPLRFPQHSCYHPHTLSCNFFLHTLTSSQHHPS